MNSFFSQKKQRKNHTRSLQWESLESRELLAASILSAPIAAYAQTDNPAEIRIDLSAKDNAAARLEFVVKQSTGSTLDPSKIIILDGNKKTVTLSNIVDNTASSRATAELKTGVYTIFVYADGGKGNLTLDIFQELSTVSFKSGLETLVAAAITQQSSPSNWAGRAVYYNSLLAGTDYAGAASALPIYKSYPEVDINGDGKVNAADLKLAQQQTEPPAPANVKAFQVIKQDLKAPTLNFALQTESSSENPVIAGRVTDTNGIKSAMCQRDGGVWTNLTLDAQGNFSIQNLNISAGKHSITVKVTDTKGNTAVSNPLIFTVTEKDNPSVLTAKQTTFNNIVSNDLWNAKKMIEPGFSVTDVDAKDKTGFIYSFSNVKDGSLTGAVGLITEFDAGKGTFSVDTSKLSNRNTASTVTLTVSVTSVSGGVVSKEITVKLAPAASPKAPVLSLNTTEKEDVTGYVEPSAAGKSVSFGALTLDEGTFPKGVAVTDIISFDEQGKFVFTPKEFFTGLSEGEVLEFKFHYTMTDTEYGLTGSGVIELTVVGKNNVPEVRLGDFVWNIPEDSDYEILNLAPYIADSDSGAELFVAKINGKSIEKNESVLLSSGATLVYLGGTKFRYQPSTQFHTLSQGDTMEENIALVLCDGFAECSAVLKTKIIGKHTPIQLLSPTQVTLPPVNLNGLQNGLVDNQIRLSKDSGDALKYTVSCVDSQQKTYPELFRFENGALYINPSEYVSLNLNETYTVTVTIENADTAYGDAPLSVVYTLNFIQRNAPVAVGNALTVSEDAPSCRIDLAARDTVDGKPLRELTGYNYSVVLKSNSSNISLQEGIDYGIEDGIFTFKLNGKFNTLSDSEKANLTFVYTIVDTEQGNGIYSDEGVITLTVNGENDAPSLGVNQDVYHTTNSSTAANASISAGISFTAIDPDGNDRALLSIGNVTGTKEGLTLQNVPTFSLDASGNLSFTNQNLPNLLPGESAAFNVEIIAVDKSGATDSKIVTVIVHAKQPPVVSVNIPQSNIVESEEAVSKRFAVSVSDASESFLVQRSGNAWYTPSKLSVNIPAVYQSLFPDWAQLFTVTGNAAEGYSIALDAPAGYFSALQESETFDVTIELTITDNEFNVTTTESFTLTVTGKGNPHTVETAALSFDYWANKREKDPALFEPHYTIYDADRNENYQFSLQSIDLVQVPNGVDAAKIASLVTLNADGTFSLDESGLAGITEDFSYNITVRVTGNTDGFEYDVPLTLNVKFAQKPVVSNVTLSTSEKESVRPNLSPTVPNDGAVRTEDWYTVTAPVYAGYYGTIPESFDIAAVARSLAVFSENTFTFQPGEHFGFLSEGEVLKIFYSYTVRDNVFATETANTVVIDIVGENDTPVFPSEQHFVVNTDGKNDTDSISVGTVVFEDVDTPLEQYTFQIANDSTGEFRIARNDPQSLFLVYYKDLFLPGQSYTFDFIATLKSDPDVSFQTTVTVTIATSTESGSSENELPSELEMNWETVLTAALPAPQLAAEV